MKLSIRAGAFLMVLAPTLLPALALSAWFTAERVRDARAELQSRGEREALYLAEASELALLVGDADALSRLAASNVKAPDAARAVLFVDPAGALLAAAGSPWEIGLAQQCWIRAVDCAGGEQRHVFGREVRSSTNPAEAGAFGGAGAEATQKLGQVVLSFDPRALEDLQRDLLWNAVLTTLGALAIAAVIANVFALRLSSPMQRLATVVARIRGGDLAARTNPAGAGELRALEEGVNAMADRVEASAADLNRRVDEATAELSHALHEREQRNRELDIALERAEAASRAKDLFLARMSHELRTPLSTVTGYAHLMQQSESPEQRADFYRPIRQASRILQRTVDDILDFVKLESGSLALERRVFELESCIEDAVMMHAPAAHTKGLDLVCDIGADLPDSVLGDSVRLSQVLTNLVSNAIKFTEQGCVRVAVSARPAEPAVDDGTRPRDGAVHVVANAHIVLEVSDTGIGIPHESVAQLFQPFAQADESMTRRFGGSGLGLSIAARIVHALGGTIDLDTEPGRGTAVRVELPFARAAQDAVEEPRLHGRVVIWAQDNSQHLAVLSRYLEAAGLSVAVREPVAARLPSDTGLLIVLEDRLPIAAVPVPGVPVLHLCPVEPHTDTAHSYLANRLPLPLRRRELLAACARLLGQAPGIEEPAPPSHPPHFSLRCLLVEDNELNRRMIATGLRNLGLEVAEAASGAEALALHADGHFDLVMLDVHMPEMDGVTLARELAVREPALPLYALTANVIGSEERALAEAGVREVLYKPVDEDRLHAILARHAQPVSCANVATSGVAAHEVLAEFTRLEAEIAVALAARDPDRARESAHQLLGAARLFTRGELESWCLRLEMALREQRRADGFDAFEHVRRALRRLRAQKDGTAGA